MSKSVKITGDKIVALEDFLKKLLKDKHFSLFSGCQYNLVYLNSSCVRNIDENVLETTGVFESAGSRQPRKRNACMEDRLGKCFQNSAMPAVRYDPKRAGTKGFVESVIS